MSEKLKQAKFLRAQLLQQRLSDEAAVRDEESGRGGFDFGDTLGDIVKASQSDPREAGFPTLAGDALNSLLTGKTRGVEGGPTGSLERGEAAKIGGAFLLSPDDQAVADVALKSIPGATSRTLETGALVIKLPDDAPGEAAGKEFIINPTGLDKGDVARFFATLPAFAKGANILGPAKTLLGKFLKPAVGTAGTSAALDVGAVALGSEQGVSGERAALGGIFAGTFNALAKPALNFALKVMQTPKFLDKKTGFLTDLGRKEAEKAGIDVAGVNRVFSQSFAEARAVGIDVNEAALMALSRQFGIKTPGAAISGDTTEQALLEAARRGKLGTKEQEIVSKLDADIATQSKEALTRRVETPTGFTSLRKGTAENQAAADINAITTVQVADDVAGGLVDDAYKTAGFPDLKSGVKAVIENQRPIAAFQGQNVKPLMDGLLKFGELSGFDPVLHRATSRILTRVKQFNAKLEKRAAGQPRTEADFIEFENLRRVMGNAASAAKNKTDKLIATQMKAELDRYLGEVVDEGLFGNNPAFFELTKEARRLAAARFKAFGGTDPAGKIVQKILADGADPERAANWIFGAAKLGGKDASAKTVTRLREALSPEEFLAVQDAGMLRLLSPKNVDLPLAKQGQVIKELFDNSPSMAKALFPKAEDQALLKNFGKLARANAIPKEVQELVSAAGDKFTFSILMRAFLRRTGSAATFRGHPAAGAVLFILARTPGTRKKVLNNIIKPQLLQAQDPILSGAAAQLGRDTENPLTEGIRRQGGRAGEGLLNLFNSVGGS